MNPLWSDIEAVIEKKSLLKHPFYQAWTAGTLTREDLAHYARQYYQQEARFPRYVSAVHSNCPDLKTRQMLLENLTHEEAGADNHPELWLRFASTVGADRASVLGAEAHAGTAKCVAAFDRLSRGSWQAGLAALYAYEAQQPAVAKTKIEGLKTKYRLDSADALGFFAVHETVDAWHSASEKRVLVEQLERDPALGRELVAAVSDACDALNALLDGVCEARGIMSCAAA
ncbi:MAG: CADD family putative folate metabolism protein [Elusimicrobia bacterium]|nr:CADD family putative folate metabolism protein [Elusimicrobiota bacterium]